MKLSLAVLAMASAGVLLYPSPGFAQQQGGTSGASANTSSQQTQPFQPFCSSSQSNHKRYWKAHGSALSGIKQRMHARRTRDRWPHY